MQVYLRTTNGHLWPAGYSGVDGLIAHASQELDNVLGAQLPGVGDDWDDAGWRTLFVADDDARPPQAKFIAIGFDAAMLDAEHCGVYSLIVHYLLNNRPPKTSRFSLNQHRLLNNRSDAVRLISEWEGWPADAKDKESFRPGERVVPLAIYRYVSAT
jgi:hypothetical protein